VAETRGNPDPDDEWGRISVHCRPEEREVIDAALDVAGQLLPGSRRFERLEAMAEEYLGEFPSPAEEVDGAAARPSSSLFRTSRRAEDLAARRAELEAETDRWAMLERIADVAAPEACFDGLTRPDDIDRRLRELAKMQNGWDEILGYCAHILKKSRIHEILGFASFRQYCEERLGLPARAVERRAALEGRMWQSPALREARRQKLSYEKLRVLARLPEKEIASSVPRARTLTCVALRREVEAAEERQMRARRRLVAPAPKRVANLLSAAIRSVRARVGMPIPDGTCLAIIAAHFLAVWGMPARARTVSQRVRERDGGWCTVPGCSHPATDSHHVVFRSQGGDVIDPANQTALCEYHHHRSVHRRYLRVSGTAPNQLTWKRGRRVFRGIPEEDPTSS
jgi:hypothetical protein